MSAARAKRPRDDRQARDKRPMSDRLTTTEAADALGVHESTVKNWCGVLPIPADKDNRGRWRFDERALNVMRTIKSLRDDGRSNESIRVIIAPETPSELEATASPAPSERQAEAPQPGGNSTSTVDVDLMANALASALVPQVAALIKENNQLAENFGRIALELGELRARLAATQAENQRLAERVTEMAPSERQARELEAQLALLQQKATMDDSARSRLLTERERLASDLEDARAQATSERARLQIEIERKALEADALRDRLASAEQRQARPWWKVWG